MLKERKQKRRKSAAVQKWLLWTATLFRRFCSPSVDNHLRQPFKSANHELRLEMAKSLGSPGARALFHHALNRVGASSVSCARYFAPQSQRIPPTRIAKLTTNSPAFMFHTEAM